MTSTPARVPATPPKGLPPLGKGSRVFVPNETELWVPGSVMSVGDGGRLEVRQNDGEVAVVSDSDVLRMNPTVVEASDDLVSLSFLHDAAVLHSMRERFRTDKIYTNVGVNFGMLIAVNPYRDLPLYKKSVMESYYGKRYGEAAPHVYTVADEAFRSLQGDGINQCVLVSGESGSGKTVTTKIVMEYLASRGGITGNRNIQDQVLESTPILEAFGNAKTQRNDNSSRFGKFIEIQFDKNSAIAGATIRTYLLEKSRLVHQSEYERNFHVFYQLTRGADEKMRQELRLGCPEDHFYLSQSGCTSIDGVDDVERFRLLRKAMSVVGLLEAEVDFVFRLVASLLHLGDIEFDKDPAGEGAVILNEKSVQAASHLLNVEEDSLRAALLSRRITAGGREEYSLPLTPQQAVHSRDSLAKNIYGKLFEWLVRRINASIDNTSSADGIIGVLDIYGFESFGSNSFEQFCINYANERLQQQFTNQLFKKEQQEYAREEIPWQYIDFGDNQAVLDLIEKPMGILALLDDECILPRSTHESLARKFYEHLLQKHTCIHKPRVSNTQFTIDHHMGPVTYSTDTFLEKNKDFIVQEHVRLISSSKSEYIRDMFALVEQEPRPAARGSSTPGRHPHQNRPTSQSNFKMVSVGSQFKDSLSKLMETIDRSATHYIRCVKPNSRKKGRIFESEMVLHQLKCGGVMESIRISAVGFPNRKTHEDFYYRYEMLVRDIPHRDYAKEGNFQEGCRFIMKKLMKEDECKVGRTKIFLRAGQLAAVEVARETKMREAAVKIQTRFRGHAQQLAYSNIKKASATIQRVGRGMVARQHVRHERQTRAAVKIQRKTRGYVARKKYTRVRNAARVLQRAQRAWGFEQRCHQGWNRYKNATITLQNSARMMKDKNEYTKTYTMVLVVQGLWRKKQAYRAQRVNIKGRAPSATPDPAGRSAMGNNRMMMDKSIDMERKRVVNKYSNEVDSVLEVSRKLSLENEAGGIGSMAAEAAAKSRSNSLKSALLTRDAADAAGEDETHRQSIVSIASEAAFLDDPPTKNPYEIATPPGSVGKRAPLARPPAHPAPPGSNKFGSAFTPLGSGSPGAGSGTSPGSTRAAATPSPIQAILEKHENSARREVQLLHDLIVRLQRELQETRSRLEAEIEVKSMIRAKLTSSSEAVSRLEMDRAGLHNDIKNLQGELTTERERRLALDSGRSYLEAQLEVARERLASERINVTPEELANAALIRSPLVEKNHELEWEKEVLERLVESEKQKQRMQESKYVELVETERAARLDAEQECVLMEHKYNGLRANIDGFKEQEAESVRIKMQGMQESEMSLKSLLDQEVTKTGKLSDDLRAARNELRSLQTQLSDKDSEVQRATGEKEAAVERARHAEGERRYYEDQISSLTTEVKEAKHLNESLENRLKVGAASWNKMKDANMALNNQVLEMRGKLAEYTKTMQDRWEKKQMMAEKQLSDSLTSTLKSEEQRMAVLERSNEALEEQVLRLQSECDAAFETAESAKRDKDQLAVALADLEAKKNDLDEQNTRLRLDKNAASLKCTELQEQMDRARSSTPAPVGYTHAEVEAIMSRHAILQEQVDRAVDERNEAERVLQNEIHALKKSFDAVVAELDIERTKCLELERASRHNRKASTEGEGGDILVTLLKKVSEGSSTKPGGDAEAFVLGRINSLVDTEKQLQGKLLLEPHRVAGHILGTLVDLGITRNRYGTKPPRRCELCSQQTLMGTDECFMCRQPVPLTGHGSDVLTQKEDSPSRVNYILELLQHHPVTEKELQQEAHRGLPHGCRLMVWQAALNDYMRDPNMPYQCDPDAESHDAGMIDDDLRLLHHVSDRSRAKVGSLLKSWHGIVEERQGLGYVRGLGIVGEAALWAAKNDEDAAIPILHAFMAKFSTKYLSADARGRWADDVCAVAALILAIDAPLADHLTAIRCSPDQYAMPWLLTLYARIFPVDDLMVLWDNLALRGAPFTFFVTVAILTQFRSVLMEQCDAESCARVLAGIGGPNKKLDVYAVVREAVAISGRLPARYHYWLSRLF